MVALEQCFCQNDFVQRFTAMLGDKQSVKSFFSTLYFWNSKSPCKRRWKRWICGMMANVFAKFPLQLLVALKSFQTSLQSFLLLDSPLGLGFDEMTLLFFRESLQWNQFRLPLSNSFTHGWKCGNIVIKKRCWLTRSSSCFCVDVACSPNGYAEIYSLVSNPF